MERLDPPPGTAVGQEEQELRERAFFSWAEFSRFFDAWCQQRLALFFVKSSMHLARCRWASAPPLYTLIDVLKYSYVRLVCKDVRAPSRPAVGPPQPGCPAFIIVKLSPLRDRLVVTECQLTHSHPACPLEFAYYFRPGHLLANACLPVRTTNKISKQFVALADVRRLLSYCKGRDHGVLDALHVLEGLFRTDPEAKLRAHGPAAFVDYFERNWAPRRDMWVRFRAFEAARDLDACALVRSHRRRLLRRLSPSRSVAQCLRDLVAMQWADATGEAAPEGPDGGGPWLEGEPRRGAQVESERTKGLGTGDGGGAPLEKEWVRELETRGGGGAQLESEKGRGLHLRDWRGLQLETPKVRGLEGSVWRAASLENERMRGPEIRDWRGGPLGDEKDWGLEGYVWRGAQLEEQGLRGLEEYAWRMAQLEERRIRVLESTDHRGNPCERARNLEGSTWRGAQLQDERASGLKTRDWKGLQLEGEKGRALEVQNWRGVHLEKPQELVPENGDQRGPKWGDERGRGPEIGEERGVRLGVKRRRGLEDIVLVQLGDTRVPGLENGDEGEAWPMDPNSRAGQGMGWGDTGGGHPGLGNGVMCGTPVGAVFEGDPEWAVTRRVYQAAGESLPDGGEREGPGEPNRLCRPSGEEEVDWEPLAKFRAACGPELADLVAEELTFARQHGTRGFRWTGAGFAIKDGTSDFFLDVALTRCSCSIHAAWRLPCRHLFAARLLTGAALFHMDLLRDCWGTAPEP
ncbi:uncharacterized protein ZSWIM9 [Trichechus manatus latirostris]|uniref:Uncharacterized protein ZSWIM9 n=1 Tax=Trichechus manatus latirostris TaxID=127582 RepID=A0A2Y9DVM2_TRIMA|nr:uncharacterized protein ZSWIM9 [Trichechus manatus latirostris]